MVASQVNLVDGAPLPVCLLINKYDLVAPYKGEKRLLALNQEYLEEFCNKSCIDGWRYVSAKTGFKVKSALKDLVAHIINHDISQYSDPHMKFKEQCFLTEEETTFLWNLSPTKRPRNAAEE